MSEKIEKILGEPGKIKLEEIPFYEASKLLLKMVEETAKLLVDDAARRNHYQTLADFFNSLSQIDGTRDYFKKFAEYFAKQSRKYSSQLSLDRLTKED